ncbi:uncharacterized protein TRIADDRAFT_34373 [Trichoplax adhaerens]|uniref:SRCR domain-containing protein n=1 Tax=Trichoplax adhaerens TaxID=10228 RepID=B3SE74_TRIAD|nr:hypothetical protein TRIADDRAFT_34373 [Trichoplax adhaerens]EDV18971.1 hypothetical protein TRIADDRAFT_34373 [Trichoplax adhaerens]|eukprot:XP_002118543.1 hypothetical protein TRIADDRAFT_34373 [Trichoplax adhaerens]
MIARKYYSVLNSGRVAIYHREQWGTICLNNKTSLVASVICRQANESEFGTVAMSDNPGRGQIWTSTRYFNCNPKASNLGQCHILSWGKNECTHSEDLWITCSRPSLMGRISC